MRARAPLVAAAALLLPGLSRPEPAGRGAPWKRHTIDASSRGADGVRLADVNGDGRLDITTGWEEGGRVRVYLNPGPARAKEPWPAVTAGEAGSVEDAVFVDLDSDGATDVVSCCEGDVRTMFVHWAPKDPTRYLDPAAWRTEAIPASRGAMQWMFSLPLQVDGRNGIDLFAGGKNEGARIGWWRRRRIPAGSRTGNGARSGTRAGSCPWPGQTWTETATPTWSLRTGRGRRAAASGWRTAAPEATGPNPGPSTRSAARDAR